MKKDSGSRFFLVAGLIAAIFLLLALAMETLPNVLAQSGQATNASWTPLFTDSFESGISSSWVVTDASGIADREYYWATTTYTASQGTSSVWATGGGADGSELAAGTDPYPNSAVSYLIHEPVALTDTTHARLTFDYWLETEAAVDILQVVASTDGVNFDAVSSPLSGNSNGWQQAAVDLANYVGESEVWVAFLFSSNAVNADTGAFVDNVALETLDEQRVYMPFIRKDPTPTPTMTPSPTPTATPPPYYYYADFNDESESDWPRVDNTHVSNDCFKWYFFSGDYHNDICDDRTDVKVSPGVDLPNGDYEIEVDARFRGDNGWWTSYGIIFDGKDDPDPDNPDLGDYYMLWVLWEGGSKHRWTVLRDTPGGKQEKLTGDQWLTLSDSVYDYSDEGRDWNEWRIVRTEDQIKVYVNDHHLRTFDESRPRTNFQVLFGVYSSTYETDSNKVAFDDYYVYDRSGARSAWQGQAEPVIISGQMEELEHLLPDDSRSGQPDPIVISGDMSELEHLLPGMGD